MVALLVALNVMAIMMSVAMPVWRQMAQREKEAELIFRGEQYRRAIALFQRRNGPGTLPPSLDVLVEQRFLRKAFKDPITGEDFVLIRQAQTAGGPGGQAGTTTGIIGVASRSEEPSIRLFEGRSAYNEWTFVFVPQAQAAAPAGNDGGAQGRGGRGDQGRGGGGLPNDGRGGRGRQTGGGGGRGPG